ncbi:hypothetical protein [Actibacterium sp. XHP0104]|uniref:hypothetical protein n=1 Tax=Actibacterium sp. XHP0104 TaxID=2984335 RepID=UPI0021E76DEB|nr:hypothetical protein [Actibacterium sp. XHP0104]MCV2883015.1 hypothetical protein [Actibacterium sp. XHP0104]
MAIVLAPIWVAILFFWVLLIPVFAVPFGALPYLLTAPPILLWAFSKNGPQPGQAAVLGLITNLGIWLLVYQLTAAGAPLLTEFVGKPDAINSYFVLGCLVAPAWGYFAAVIYRWLEPKSMT